MKIPVAEKTLQLTTEAPATPKNPQIASANADLIADLGKTLQTVADYAQKVKDQHEITQANIDLTNDLNKIHQEARQDPDIFNAPAKIKARLQEALENAAGKISTRTTQEAYRNDATVAVAKKEFTISTELYKRQLDAGRATTIARNDQLMNEYYAATTPAERENIRLQIAGNLDSAVNSNFVNRTWATELLRKTETHLRIGQVENDMNVDPESTYKGLLQGEKGPYPDLTAKERSQLGETAKRMAERRTKEKEQIRQIAQLQGEKEMYDRYFAGQLTIGDVDDALAHGQIRTSFGDSMKKNLTSPAAIAVKEDDYDTKESIYAMLFDDTGKYKASEIKQAILDASTAGKIKTTTRDRLLFSTIKGNKKSVEQATLEEMQQKPGILSTIGHWIMNCRHISQKGKQEVADKVLDQVNQDKLQGTVEEAVKKALQSQVITEHPYITSYPTDGMLMTDIEGNQAVVYPDGRVEEQ